MVFVLDRGNRLCVSGYLAWICKRPEWRQSPQTANWECYSLNNRVLTEITLFAKPSGLSTRAEFQSTNCVPTMAIHLLRSLIVVSGLAHLVGSHLARAEWGSIEGRVVASAKVERPRSFSLDSSRDIPDGSLIVNEKNLGIANVAIYLSEPPARIHPDLTAIPTTPAKFQAKDCRFQPHFLLTRAGQPVSCTNADQEHRQFHIRPINNDGENFLLAPSDQTGKTVLLPKHEKLPVLISSEADPFMMAYWLVLDHPYVALTNADGYFKIENLPAGEHSFRVWHELAGSIDRDYKVTVTARQLTTREITVPAETLKRK